MIAVALLLAVQAAPMPAQPDDVVVTGQRMARLKRLHMVTRRDRKSGVVRCVFKRRSGDPTLDAAVCDAILACEPTARTAAEMRACIAPTMAALVAKDVPWQAEVLPDRRNAKAAER